MENEIILTNISKTYPGGTEALKGVSLKVPGGTTLALLGPNGAGKSTLVRIMTTLSRPDDGTVRIGGLPPEDNVRTIQRIIGMASQENDLDPTATVRDHLVFQGRLFGLSRREARGRAEELISEFLLEEETAKKTADLSGGNKRKLHCALALVHRPAVLFLDEPTVGMDPEARAAFRSTLRKYREEKGATIFLTTQYLEEAEKSAEEMALLMNGLLEFTGKVDRFKQEVHPEGGATLEESYLKWMAERKEAAL